jgi:hypothetical protein
MLSSFHEAAIGRFDLAPLEKFLPQLPGKQIDLNDCNE